MAWVVLVALFAVAGSAFLGSGVGTRAGLRRLCARLLADDTGKP